MINPKNMETQISKFQKIVILDSVIFYPEHRQLLRGLAHEVVEYPSSLPESLEKQYEDTPELFIDKKCYTQLGADNTPAQLLMNRIEGADVVVSCWTNIPDEVLRLNPQLKLIVFWTHEKEHRINVSMAEKMGITIANIPDYGTDAVAEVVFAGLLSLIRKNFSTTHIANTEYEKSLSVMESVFDKLRLLSSNEKKTRSGKFTHHFHKLGTVDFTFQKNSIEDLIPERLLEEKTVSIINTTIPSLKSWLEAFGCRVNFLHDADDNSAKFYKTIAMSDVVVIDSLELKLLQLQKLNVMIPHKIVDLRKLTRLDYTLNGKRLGIVGLGRIGTKVARLAKSLGFEVAYYSKNREIELQNSLGISYLTLDELARESDVISLHVPAHKAENVINADIVRKFKKGMMFINTADGNAVDQHTLTNRMHKNEITAYLDVYPGLPRKDILGLPMVDRADWKIKDALPNCVLAYRAGWKSQESINVKTYKLLGVMADYLIRSNYNGEVAENVQAQTSKV